MLWRNAAKQVAISSRYKADPASACLKKKCILFSFLPFLTWQVAANRTQVIQCCPGQETLLLCKMFQVLMVDADDSFSLILCIDSSMLLECLPFNMSV
jgi:hypothetical protein